MSSLIGENQLHRSQGEGRICHVSGRGVAVAAKHVRSFEEVNQWIPVFRVFSMQHA